MKILVSIMAAFIMLVISPIVIPVSQASADEVDGNFTYIVKDSNAYLTRYTGSESTLTLPTTIGGHNVVGTAGKVLAGNATVKSLVIPGVYQSFEREAFADSDIDSAVFEEGCTGTGKLMFCDCKSLTTVHFPSTLTSYWTCMFTHCDALTSIGVHVANPYFSSHEGNLYNKNGTVLKIYANGKPETSFIAPDSLERIDNPGLRDAANLKYVDTGNKRTTIDAYYWFGGPNLETARIGDSVTTIEGVYGFSDGLTNITVSPSNPAYCSEDGVLYTKNKSKLVRYPTSRATTDYTSPSSVSVIGSSAFTDVRILTKITFTGKIQTIESNAFERFERGSGMGTKDRVGRWYMVFEGGVDRSGVDSNALFYSEPIMCGGSDVGAIADMFSLSHLPSGPKSIEVPKARADLHETGDMLVGVEPGEGYVLGGNTGSWSGKYKATATLELGYRWKDGTTSPKTITWEIGDSVPTNPSITISSSMIRFAQTTHGTYEPASQTVTITYNDCSVATPVNEYVLVDQINNSSNGTEGTISYRITPKPNIDNGATTSVEFTGKQLGDSNGQTVSTTLTVTIDKAPDQPAPNGIAVYRLYNKWTGEHLFTAKDNEKDTLTAAGWKYEGVGWQAPESSDIPIYRLFNTYTGEHLYTKNKVEYDSLMIKGWDGEGAVYYSADESGKPVYRLFNPYGNGVTAHHFTTDSNEREMLTSGAYQDEGLGWYGLG